MEDVNTRRPIFFLNLDKVLIIQCQENSAMLEKLILCLSNGYRIRLNHFISKVFVGGVGYSLIWPIRGCAARQGIVSVFSTLNRVYNFARVCPKNGIQFRESVLKSVMSFVLIMVINLRVLS